jgi:hypothetical protein
VIAAHLQPPCSLIISICALFEDVPRALSNFERPNNIFTSLINSIPALGMPTFYQEGARLQAFGFNLTKDIRPMVATPIEDNDILDSMSIPSHAVSTPAKK